MILDCISGLFGLWAVGTPPTASNFGTSIFEPVAKEIACLSFKEALSQQSAGHEISADAFLAIEHIMNGLTTATANPDQESEIAEIRNVC